MVTRPCPRSIRTSLRKRRDAHNHAEVSPEFYAAAAGKPLLSGVIAAHQTFGDQLRWNPHHHCLVLEEALDEHGTFIPVPLSGLEQMTEVFRPRLIRLSVEKELVSGEFARNLLLIRGYGLYSSRTKERWTQSLTSTLMASGAGRTLRALHASTIQQAQEVLHIVYLRGQ